MEESFERPYKDRGTIVKCDIKNVPLDDELETKIVSFIFVADGGYQYEGLPNTGETRGYRNNFLLNGFIRFNIISKCDGERRFRIFNINMNKEIKSGTKQLRIRDKIIIDLEQEYKNKNFDSLYVFSITTSGDIEGE